MKWGHLSFLFHKFIIGALIALFAIPFLANILSFIGIDYSHLKVPIVGGIIFFICYLLHVYFCPDLIIKYKSENDYSNWAVGQNINSYEEFTMALEKSEQYFKRALGNKFDIFYPLDKGLINAREDCIKEYAKIEFKLNNCKNWAPLYLISTISVIAIVMINWLALNRIYTVLGGG